MAALTYLAEIHAKWAEYDKALSFLKDALDSKTTAWFVIGRANSWQYPDYELTAEWCNVQITIGLPY
jgi:hypothetical protein